jgi:translocation and assembly module TamB
LVAVLSQVPAKIANTFVPSLGLDGSISGTATVRGTPAAPIATINTSWKNAIARAMRENHLPAVNIKLEGGYRNGTASAKVNVRGPQAFSLSAVGDAQFKAGKRINLRIQGDAPLALGNAAMATRATQLSGRAIISGNVGGTIDTPKVAATINIPNATIHDPSSGLKLKQVVGLLKLTEQGLDIQTFKGKSDLGGTVSLSGTITTGANKSTRAQLNVQLAKMKFNDHQMLAGEVDGKVTLAGPLDALAADGSVYIRRMDVTVPAAAPRSIAALSIKHVNASGRAPARGKHTQKPVQSGGPVRVALNLRIDAANRIFVKGRGLDAQLGGGLKVLGRANAPIMDGAFNMKRGRPNILGRRLDFRRGRIIFDGALEPVLDMEAVTVADKITIVVSIAGVASKPAFKFSSKPELPEDEIIARLLFNKALVGLSPLQLVQLASEVDKIGGLSSGPGIMDKLKSSVGIDVLDVSTDKTGAATVSAGSYLTDKTYVGVRQGANANSSRVIIDHDFTKNLKARGEVGADGNSKLGIGLEWNY